jgi:hypothetical protein
MDRPPGRPAPAHGHLKRRGDELGAHVRLHRPADDPAAEEVLNRRQVQPALAGADLLDVRRPYAVNGIGVEVATDEVAERLNALHGHLQPLRRRRRCAPWRPASAINLATRFSPPWMPCRRSTAWTLGLP